MNTTSRGGGVVWRWRWSVKRHMMTVWHAECSKRMIIISGWTLFLRRWWSRGRNSWGHSTGIIHMAHPQVSTINFIFQRNFIDTHKPELNPFFGPNSRSFRGVESWLGFGRMRRSVFGTSSTSALLFPLISIGRTQHGLLANSGRVVDRRNGGAAPAASHTVGSQFLVEWWRQLY